MPREIISIAGRQSKDARARAWEQLRKAAPVRVPNEKTRAMIQRMRKRLEEAGIVVTRESTLKKKHLPDGDVVYSGNPFFLTRMIFKGEDGCPCIVLIHEPLIGTYNLRAMPEYPGHKDLNEGLAPSGYQEDEYFSDSLYIPLPLKRGGLPHERLRQWLDRELVVFRAFAFACDWKAKNPGVMHTVLRDELAAKFGGKWA